MLRVLIADDHPMYREGLRGLLESTSGIEVVAAVADGAAAIEAARTVEPDVILMDLQMPGCNGIAAAESIRAQVASPPGIIFLTMYQDDESVLAAIRAGGHGYVLKGADGGEILRAIQAVASGGCIFSPGVADTVMGQKLAEPVIATSKPFPELTDRERELLALIATGVDNQTIARQLVISEKTVRNHVSSIFFKLGVSSRGAAIVLARENGLFG